MHSFRLFTINLWNQRGDPRALAALIERYAPDVVLAQEMTAAHADVIARALPYGLLLPRDDTHGMGLALRWPAQCERIALPGRDALIARPNLDTEFEIVNVHLSAPTRLGRSAMRREQVATLTRHLRARPIARVLAGDLNSLSVMPAYRALCRHLRDAALERTRFARPTWSPGARLPRLLRIDHVLLAGMTSLELATVRVRGSDHSGLLATLALDTHRAT